MVRVPIEALKHPGGGFEEVLDNCVDDATVGRYAGNINHRQVASGFGRMQQFPLGWPGIDPR